MKTEIKPLPRVIRRLSALRYHATQRQLLENPARFKIVPAGRRSGKTELAKRQLVSELLNYENDPAPWSDPRLFAAAPTRDQAKRIWWADLKRMIDPRLCTVSETELCIKTKWGAELWVIGLDVPARIEGVGWDGCVIDELANVKPGAWDANIRPALADRHGWAWLIGVPDMDAPGQIDYERMVEYARSGVDPEWACFSWPSADILPAEEVESARRTMDPRIFEQEYGGKFVLAGGRAFPDFDAENIRENKYNPALPLCWSLDFNVDPFCTLVGQHDSTGTIRIIDEIIVRDIRTNVMCDAFMGTALQNKWNLRGLQIYGDPAGDQRRTSASETDWQIVRNATRDIGAKFNVRRAHPTIKDTVNAVNARIKSADGQRHFVVDPKCRTLISDLKSALWPSTMEEFHAVAALRYFIEYEYPILEKVSFASGFQSMTS